MEAFRVRYYNGVRSDTQSQHSLNNDFAKKLSPKIKTDTPYLGVSVLISALNFFAKLLLTLCTCDLDSFIPIIAIKEDISILVTQNFPYSLAQG